MTTEKQDSDFGDDEPTNSANACFLLEIASILAVATTDVVELGQYLSISNSQVVEINTSLEDPKNKVLHLLEKFRDRHGNEWQSELESVARDRLNNPNLAREINSVKPNVKKEPSATGYQSQKSAGQSSEWEVTSRNTSFGQSDHGDDRSSESFERLSEENVFVLRDGEQPAKDEEHHASFDQPEMSMQIAKVGEALKVVSDLLGDVEGINLLPEIVPQILKLVRQMKSQKMLRLVFEEENSNLKQDLQRANEIIRELRESLDKLEAELVDLKKATEDKSLGDFDYVTRKEAQDMKEQQKKEEEKPTSSAQTSQTSSANEGVSIEAYEALQKKIISLKQKLTQVVKLNHSWDEQYHLMEGALKVEIEKMQGQLAERKAEDERREREREEMVTAAKLETEKSKAETSALQVQLDKTTRQLTKMKGYAHSLQEHKQDLEAEVKRLNEALEQKVKEKTPAPTPCPAHGTCKTVSKAKPRRSGEETQLMSREERSILESMPQDVLIEELGLLKQQVDIYKSDFYKEQRDRQRAMGELDEVRTELHRTKKRMEKQKHELQIIQDQALAYKYHAKEHKLDRPAAVPRQSQPRPAKKPQQASPNVYMGLNGHRPQQQYQTKYKPRDVDELVPHGGGLNYAMNDEFVDAPDNFQVYYPPASGLSDDPHSGEPLREDDPFYHEIP